MKKGCGNYWGQGLNLSQSSGNSETLYKRHKETLGSVLIGGGLINPKFQQKCQTITGDRLVWKRGHW